jgi:hypothetical protein
VEGTVKIVRGGSGSFKMKMTIKRTKVGATAGTLSNPGEPCHGTLRPLAPQRRLQPPLQGAVALADVHRQRPHLHQAPGQAAVVARDRRARR